MRSNLREDLTWHEGSGEAFLKKVVTVLRSNDEYELGR